MSWYERMKAVYKMIYIYVYMLLIILFSQKFILTNFMKRVRQMVLAESDIFFEKVENTQFIKQENKKGQGVIVMMNHYTGIDPLFLYNYIDFYSIVKNELLGEVINEDESWLLTYMKDEFFEKTKCIPYKRGNKKSGEEIKKYILENTQSGKNILIFPEGTTQECFKKPLPFKKGIFELAYENKIPIFSVSVNYSKDIGLSKRKGFDLVDVILKKPDAKIIFNGIFYPKYYSSMESLYFDVYDSISENVLIEWK